MSLCCTLRPRISVQSVVLVLPQPNFCRQPPLHRVAGHLRSFSSSLCLSFLGFYLIPGVAGGAQGQGDGCLGYDMTTCASP